MVKGQIMNGWIMVAIIQDTCLTVCCNWLLLLWSQQKNTLLFFFLFLFALVFRLDRWLSSMSGEVKIAQSDLTTLIIRHLYVSLTQASKAPLTLDHTVPCQELRKLPTRCHLGSVAEWNLRIVCTTFANTDAKPLHRFGEFHAFLVMFCSIKHFSFTRRNEDIRTLLVWSTVLRIISPTWISIDTTVYYPKVFFSQGCWRHFHMVE